MHLACTSAIPFPSNPGVVISSGVKSCGKINICYFLHKSEGNHSKIYETSKFCIFKLLIF